MTETKQVNTSSEGYKPPVLEDPQAMLAVAALYKSRDAWDLYDGIDVFEIALNQMVETIDLLPYRLRQAFAKMNSCDPITVTHGDKTFTVSRTDTRSRFIHDSYARAIDCYVEVRVDGTDDFNEAVEVAKSVYSLINKISFGVEARSASSKDNCVVINFCLTDYY